MDAATLAIVEQIARLGLIGTYALFIVLLIAGILRIGKQVDGDKTLVETERARERAEWAEEKKRLIAEGTAREEAIRTEYARRETQLVGERDQWRDRSIATDERLDRVAGAFERIARTPAPQ